LFDLSLSQLGHSYTTSQSPFLPWLCNDLNEHQHLKNYKIII
jgi:hypothetical protein